jgi:hypothetical protein
MEPTGRTQEETMRKRKPGIRKTAGAMILAVLALIAAAPPATAERKGADLKVHQNGGAVTSGELIGVSETALILKSAETGGDIRLLLEDVSRLEIKKKPAVGTGMLLGALAGFVGGLAIGASEKSSPGSSPVRKAYFWGATFSFSNTNSWESLSKIGISFVGAGTGAILGAGLAMAIMGRTYWVAGMSAQARGVLLKDLRLMARVPDYQ